MLRVDTRANEGTQAQPRSAREPWPDMEAEGMPTDPLDDPLTDPVTDPLSNPITSPLPDTGPAEPPNPDDPRDSVEEPMVPPRDLPEPPGDSPPETPDSATPGPSPPVSGAHGLGPEADFGGGGGASPVARMAARIGDDDPDAPLDSPPLLP